MTDVLFVKYCPQCGMENPRQQTCCSQCLDGDLTTVSVEPRRKDAQEHKPTPVVSEPPPEWQPETGISTARVSLTAPCTIESLDDPAVRFQVQDGQTVGRTDKADVILTGVPKLDWISGAHAKFFRKGDQWYVQHIGATNFIKVDGEMYQGHEEVAIYEGSILILSLTPFRVTLGSKAC